MEDNTLVERSLQGDRQALETLLGRHRDFIYNVALRLYFNTDDALDATQEVLLKVVTRLNTFERRSRFSTWLYRITVNHFLNRPKSRGEERLQYPAHELQGFDEAVEEGEIDEQVKEETRVLCATAMLMCLDREQRLIFIIGDTFGADHQLGAQLFETSPANFRVKLHRSRQDLLSFVRGKCGLIDPNNPCRCHKKAKRLVSAGVVDEKRLVFHQNFKEKVQAFVLTQKDQLGDQIYLQLRDLFRDSPFQIKRELEGLLSKLP